MKITNTSKAAQGIHTPAGLVFIEPGKTRDVDVSPGYVGRVRALPFLSLDGDPRPFPELGKVSFTTAEADGMRRSIADLTAENDRLQGEVERLTRDLEAATAPPITPAAPEFDAMSDDDLRAFIEKRDDRKPHPAAKRETLLAKARGEDAE